MRSRIWTTAIAVGLFIILTLVMAAPRPSVVSKRNFERVQEGMTEREVEDLFGQESSLEWPGIRESTRCWICREGMAEIRFDAQNRVIKKAWIKSDEMPPVVK